MYHFADIVTVITVWLNTVHTVTFYLNMKLLRKSFKKLDYFEIDLRIFKLTDETVFWLYRSKFNL